MFIFAVVLTKTHPDFISRLREKHPEAYQLNDMSFLVASKDNSLEVAAALGLREETQSKEGDIIRGIVIQINEYAGYGENTLGDWIQSSQEESK